MNGSFVYLPHEKEIQEYAKTIEHLKKQELGESFITYMKGWKGFVVSE